MREETQTSSQGLARRMDQLGSSSTIPRNVEKAFRTRLLTGYTGTITTAQLTVSGTTGSMTFKDGVLITQVSAT